MGKTSRRAGKTFISTAVVTLAVLLCISLAGAQEEDKPTADLYVDILSQYIFRGVAFSNDSVVIEPSFTASYKGFSLNFWGNFDTSEDEDFGETGGDANWNETDVTFSYSRGIYGGLSGTVGGVYYSLVGDDSFEVFGGLSYEFPWVTLGVLGYREVSHFPGWWLQFDISRNIELPCYGMSVDLGASFGYQSSEDSGDDYEAWHSGQLLAALNVPVGKYVKISPRIGFAFPLSGEAADRIESLSWDQEENHLFGGLRVSASF